ncbi:hypothetical protein [Mycetohabitans rhizoxinica]|uniref:Uncharacterized protein n=1 Tax=Mycetohabitans rhizoxinica TaxID=412963 RepID=A0ABZ2PT37_9BURK
MNEIFQRINCIDMDNIIITSFSTTATFLYRWRAAQMLFYVDFGSFAKEKCLGGTRFGSTATLPRW